MQIDPVRTDDAQRKVREEIQRLGSDQGNAQDIETSLKALLAVLVDEQRLSADHARAVSDAFQATLNDPEVSTDELMHALDTLLRGVPGSSEAVHAGTSQGERGQAFLGRAPPLVVPKHLGEEEASGGIKLEDLAREADQQRGTGLKG